jgi:hypothetical protein
MNPEIDIKMSKQMHEISNVLQKGGLINDVIHMILFYITTRYHLAYCDREFDITACSLEDLAWTLYTVERKSLKKVLLNECGINTFKLFKCNNKRKFLKITSEESMFGYQVIELLELKNGFQMGLKYSDDKIPWCDWLTCDGRDEVEKYKNENGLCEIEFETLDFQEYCSLLKYLLLSSQDGYGGNYCSLRIGKKRNSWTLEERSTLDLNPILEEIEPKYRAGSLFRLCFQ